MPSGDEEITRDERSWREHPVLSFDGGGVKGYASLLLIRRLMEAIKKIETEHETPYNSSFRPIYQPRRESDDQTTVGHSSHMKERATQTPPWRQSSFPGQKQQREKPKVIEHAPEVFLPCHYFDYIVGTSTGGLNAIMLGRLRMSVVDCIDTYPEMVKKIFGKPRLQFFKLRNKYDPKHLKRVIQDLVADHRMSVAQQSQQIAVRLNNYPSPGDLCKTLVIANEIAEHGQIERPYRFRTYDHGFGRDSRQGPVNYGAANNEEIWKIARATSAAPTYFAPVRIGSLRYSDGGSGLNNPAGVALQEVAHHVGEHEAFAVPILVSIGTGLKAENMGTTTTSVCRKRDVFKKKVKAIAQAPIRERIEMLHRFTHQLTNTENIHREMERLREDGKFVYCRLNPDEKVGALELDEWDDSKRSFITTEVERYLSDPDIKREIEDVANRLVTLRRIRIAEDPWQWTRFASCKLIRCFNCAEAFGTFQEMKTHLKKNHRKHTINKSKAELFTLIEQQCSFEDSIIPGGPW